MSTKPADRLAFEVKFRRMQLDLNQVDLAAAGGPSNTTMTTIENARLTELTRATARKLDRALRWEAGSAMRVWNGKGRPKIVGGPIQDDGYVASPGPRVDFAVPNLEVLAELRAMREDQRAMLERLEKLEQQGS